MYTYKTCIFLLLFSFVKDAFAYKRQPVVFSFFLLLLFLSATRETAIDS